MTAARALSLYDRQQPSKFDELRVSEYSRLDADNQVYLDFTGSALYAESQITAQADRLKRSILGNPHSENGPSLLSTAMINNAKTALLGFLDADEDEYVVVFTANASAAIRLVAESFPFNERAPLVLTADNHNSMNGIREFAKAKGARVRYVALDGQLRFSGTQRVLRETKDQERGLFGFPAQSNFSGVKHPLGLVREAQRAGYAVLLDAASYLPTNRLSLRQHPADFVVLSLYKMTGFPTGVGALVAKRRSLLMLTRPWFAGGTVEYASVQHGVHQLIHRNGEGFEDGTPSFIDIASVSDGLAYLESIGMENITAHVSRHRARFVEELSRLSRACGGRLVTIYGSRSPHECGATVAFNLNAASGRVIPYSAVVERARNEGVALRGGCFCNPGAAEKAFAFPPERTLSSLRAAADAGFTIRRFSEILGRDIPVGAVRASMGIPTNERDIDRALAVIRTFA